MMPIIPDTHFRFAGQGRAKALAVSAVLLAGSGLQSPAAIADEASIRAYLAQDAATAYLQRGDVRIERVDTKGGPNDAVVFQKFINDIPLHGGQLAVFESADGNVTRVVDDSTRGLRVRPETARLDATAAKRRVRARHVLDSSAKQVWFRTANQATLAWEVTTRLADSGKAASPTGLETVIDARTGAVLSQRQIDTKTYAPGSPEAADGVFPRIVINDAIGPAGSQAYAAPFDAIPRSSVGCTGVLIAPNVVLSARHCGIGAGSTMTFGDSSVGGGDFSITVQSSFLPAGGGSLLDGGDVSIHTLTGPVPDTIATPMRLIDETTGLVGQVAATIGYGFNGVGSTGHQFTADGNRWGGEIGRAHV